MTSQHAARPGFPEGMPNLGTFLEKHLAEPPTPMQKQQNLDEATK
jgi:hypothetical protein